MGLVERAKSLLEGDAAVGDVQIEHVHRGDFEVCEDGFDGGGDLISAMVAGKDRVDFAVNSGPAGDVGLREQGF